MLSKKEIEAIAKKIAETVKVKEIILFGSYAKNVVTEDSDVDLCILVEDENVEKLELDRKIRKVLYETDNYKSPLDIVIYSTKEFFNENNYKFGFENEIKKTGVKIYG